MHKAKSYCLNQNLSKKAAACKIFLKLHAYTKKSYHLNQNLSKKQMCTEIL